VSLDVFSECAESPSDDTESADTESTDTEPDDTESADEEIARLVAASLDSEQWSWLRRWLTQQKRQQMRDMDLASLDVSFDPAVATESSLVEYCEVFPFAEQPIFKTDSGIWIVDDQHCVQPRCRCTDCALSFFPLPDESVDPDTAYDRRALQKLLDHEVAIWDDLRRRSWKMDQPSALSRPATRPLVRALEQARPDLTSFLAFRRKQLRQLYAQWLAKHQQYDPPSTRQVAVKIGRNDPCPCGSGRKYKRCCGR
jgi:hypothetical protein